ncbi:MAG: KaiC domain-containing protein [Halanaeroarchaeum sp.]
MADSGDSGGEADESDEDWFERGLKRKRGDESPSDEAEPAEETEDETRPDSPGAEGSVPDDGGAMDPERWPGAGTDTDFESDFAEAFGGGEGEIDQAEGGAFELDLGGGTEGGESFGFDLGGGPGPTDFEEEDFDSVIPRIDLGIEGLDEMIQGGVPERSLIVTIGGAGTGKTTFGLQFLHEALSDGERAIFITLEESHDRILQSASEKGWDFEQYEEEGQLAILDLDPVDMANSLTSIRNELPRLIEEFGASRLVLDSVSLLEMMYDEQATRRTEIYDFSRALKEAGVTTMLTSEANQDNPYASRHGIIEYLTDAVIVLRYVRPENFRETRLAVEIQKIRDANHSRETKPYEITGTGISVYRQANIF